MIEDRLDFVLAVHDEPFELAFDLEQGFRVPASPLEGLQGSGSEALEAVSANNIVLHIFPDRSGLDIGPGHEAVFEQRAPLLAFVKQLGILDDTFLPTEEIWVSEQSFLTSFWSEWYLEGVEVHTCFVEGR